MQSFDWPQYILWSPDIKMQVVQKQHDATKKKQNKKIFYILEEEM